MVSFATAAANRDQRWVIIVTIEGVGNYAGQHKFCTQIPTYAVGDANYRQWIMEWPDILSERINILGGLPEGGEIEIQILDFDNTLTDEWRIDADPLTHLSAALTASGTSVTLANNTGVTAGTTVLRVGNEALRVTASTGPFTVTRGWLDTDAFAHLNESPVWSRLSYLMRRRLRLYIAPIDGDSASDEREFGNYVIDGVSMTEDLNGFVLRAKSRQRWLARMVPRRKGMHFQVMSYNHPRIGIRNTESPGGPEASTSKWPSKWVYLKIDDEIIAVDTTSNADLTIRRRALLGTLEHDIHTEAPVELLFAAEEDQEAQIYAGSEPTMFRNSPGPSPSSSRSTGTWNRSAHWIDILLNLLVSSADSSDGLELNNRNATYGAWDCLPVGVGIGIPQTQIDWASAVRIAFDTPDERFNDFYIGPDPVPFGELITEWFLKPLGAYLTTSGGIVRIVRNRPPTAGSSVLAIGAGDILRKEVGAGLYAQGMRAHYEVETVPSVVLNLLDRSISINNGDLSGIYGRSYYGTEDKALELDVRVRSDRQGMSDMLTRAALRRMARYRRPAWRLHFATDLSWYTTDVAAIVDITHADMPNLSAGTRGWTSVLAEVIERRVNVSPETGAVLEYDVLAYETSRVGVITPSARIVSVANAGGNPDVTVSANRYTRSDAPAAYPSVDASAFTVGDVLRVHNRKGDQIAVTDQTILAISGNVITVNGNFGATLTNGTGNAGQILEYADRSKTVDAQHNTFVFWSDKPNRNVGSSTQTPWEFGDA